MGSANEGEGGDGDVGSHFPAAPRALPFGLAELDPASGTHGAPIPSSATTPDRLLTRY